MMCYVPDTRHLFSRGWGSKDFTVYRYIGKSIDEFCILCEENVIFFFQTLYFVFNIIFRVIEETRKSTKNLINLSPSPPPQPPPQKKNK